MRLFSLLILSTVLFACHKKTETDLILYNATIYSVNANFDVHSAMAVKDGKIIEIGSSDQILNNYEADLKLDLNNKTVYPGFYDAHAHYFGYADNLRKVNLKGCINEEEMIARVIKHRNKYPNTAWILGRGWDQNLWENKTFPTKHKLDSLFPDVPISLTRVDGHATLVNQKALDLAKIDESTFIEGGKIIVENGRLTGVLLDNAEEVIDDFIPIDPKNVRIQSYLEAQKNILAVGITSLVDCGVTMDWIKISDSLHKSGDLKLKLNLLLNPVDENFDYAKTNGKYQSERMQIQGFKVYADGALGSRGACLLKPYTDDPGNRGFLLSSEEQLLSQTKEIHSLGFQMNTHAIGDSANRLMLNIYNDILGDDTLSRWRIEHAQVVHPDDHGKFKKNKIIPSVQPTHCTSDMFWADERLGEERIHHAYAYKSLMQNAGILAMGSDFPVEDINPLYGFHAAIARVDSENEPNGGFQMTDAISREEALKGMTIWAAYSVFEEDRKGSLEAGKEADFVILDKDIMQIDPTEIRDVKVLETYISGEKVF